MKWIIFFYVYFSTVVFSYAQNTISLNNDWVFSEAGKGTRYSAEVPGSVQLSLIKQHRIPSPFVLLNEDSVQWVSDRKWVFERSLIVSSQQLLNERINLVFEGLDTYAKVYVNDQQVLHADNMFRRWSVDIKPHLKKGKNRIRIDFPAIQTVANKLAKATTIRYPADNEVGDLKISPFVRKAAFQFGWDFAPRLLTVGIWKPVYLELVQKAKIADVQLTWSAITKQKATGNYTVHFDRIHAGPLTLEVENLTTGLISRKTIPASGDESISGKVNIIAPRLWWPNGLGNPNLYRFRFNLMQQGKTLDSKTLTTGIRTIEVVNKPDKDGESFYVKVNGRPVFAKGANWVPVSSLPDAASGKRLGKLFADMKESHFNMIRVWGGGIYESDDFYRKADENGIMVWQDFPFACTMYPADAAFLKNVEQEAIDNIKRLRNHASLALWCGNNEIAVGWKNWGWQTKYGYSKADSIQLINDYKLLFDELLPQTLAKYDSGRFYFPSSPISNWGTMNDLKYGDNHYWGVYHGELPFSAYETHVPRFNSEFGFQSFPSWSLLQQITKDEQPSPDGAVLTARQKSYKGNGLLTKYMNWYYKPAISSKDFVYKSQLVQAEGMKTAIEAARRKMPFSMGTLVWQLNDVWPAISWSSIDYSGQWKAAQYFIKKAYAQVLLSATATTDSLQVFVVSDNKAMTDGELKVTRWNMQGQKELVWKGKFPTRGNHVNDMQIPLTTLQMSDKTSEFLHLEYYQGNNLVSSAYYYFLPVKDLQLPKRKISHRFAVENGKTFLYLQSNQLAKNVQLEAEGTETHFADNYFDMLPGKQYKIAFTTNDLQSLKKGIRITSIRNQTK